MIDRWLVVIGIVAFLMSPFVVLWFLWPQAAVVAVGSLLLLYVCYGLLNGRF